jgi:predicted enzyme involved in methoxymalonyl-ACP biosynthesis
MKMNWKKITNTLNTINKINLGNHSLVNLDDSKMETLYSLHNNMSDFLIELSEVIDQNEHLKECI